MSWVVAVVVGDVALEAEIEVIARYAGHELTLRKDDHAVVARAGGRRGIGKRLRIIGKGTWDLLLHIKLIDLHWLLGTRRDALRGAVDDLAIP